MLSVCGILTVLALLGYLLVMVFLVRFGIAIFVLAVLFIRFSILIIGIGNAMDASFVPSLFFVTCPHFHA